MIFQAAARAVGRKALPPTKCDDMPSLCLYFPSDFADKAWAGSSFSLEAPDGENGQVREGEWIVGRLPTCALTIAIQSVSRRHCLLAYSYGANQWTVTDLGGRNGTRLNGELLTPGDPHPVKIGDRLHLGPNPVNIVENELSTESTEEPTTIASLTPLDHKTGKALQPPPPPPETPPPAPKTLADTLYLAASWLIAPSTALGTVYRFVVLAVGALVVVLVMGAV